MKRGLYLPSLPIQPGLTEAEDDNEVVAYAIVSAVARFGTKRAARAFELDLDTLLQWVEGWERLFYIKHGIHREEA